MYTHACVNIFEKQTRAQSPPPPPPNDNIFVLKKKIVVFSDDPLEGVRNYRKLKSFRNAYGSGRVGRGRLRS